MTISFTSGATKDDVVYFQDDDTLHVLVPHHAQRIYDPLTDLTYEYIVTHEARDGWELVSEIPTQPGTYEVTKKSSADGIAPSATETLYTLKLKQEEENE